MLNSVESIRLWNHVLSATTGYRLSSSAAMLLHYLCIGMAKGSDITCLHDLTAFTFPTPNSFVSKSLLPGDVEQDTRILVERGLLTHDSGRYSLSSRFISPLLEVKFDTSKVTYLSDKRRRKTHL